MRRASSGLNTVWTGAARSPSAGLPLPVVCARAVRACRRCGHVQSCALCLQRAGHPVPGACIVFGLDGGGGGRRGPFRAARARCMDNAAPTCTRVVGVHGTLHQEFF